jgi:hypothetical protein
MLSRWKLTCVLMLIVIAVIHFLITSGANMLGILPKLRSGQDEDSSSHAGALAPTGKDIVLVVGTDGFFRTGVETRQNITDMVDMVRENRQQYADLHGTPPPSESL